MASGIGFSSDILELTDNVVDVIFNRELVRPIKTFYPEICMEKTISTPTGTYQQLGGLTAAAVKPEGDNIPLDTLVDSYQTTITVQTVAKGVKASYEKLADDQYNVVNRAFGAPLVKKMTTYKERVIADLYNHAFATTGADGQYQIDSDHPLENSALTNNNLATGVLSVDNLKAAYNKFTFIYDAGGEFFGSSPTHLLAHTNKMFTIVELLESNLLAHELSNTKNSLMDLRIKPILNPYLDYNTTTDGSPWFLLDRTLEAGAVLQRQKGIETHRWVDEDNWNYCMNVIERFGQGIIAPGYGIVGSLGGYTA